MMATITVEEVLGVTRMLRKLVFLGVASTVIWWFARHIAGDYQMEPGDYSVLPDWFWIRLRWLVQATYDLPVPRGLRHVIFVGVVGVSVIIISLFLEIVGLFAVAGITLTGYYLLGLPFDPTPGYQFVAAGAILLAMGAMSYFTKYARRYYLDC